VLQSMPDPDDVEFLEAQLKKMRSSISDLGYQVDSYKTKTAAALGGGVFLLLLAAGAVYDLVAGKVGMWLTLGATRETLVWITSGLGAGATILLVFGFRRVQRSEISAKARLEELEQEYADLLERRDAGAQSGV
jgi:hypothetical protein